jgi:UDP-N-acetylglucosamine diphosphorylase / glucose-1-phosphate thymidylyltransferase / UDP-N-acetylgalactosamine diphosphorylase / glucosamine-1-phosphate N-acetyltransferase / galactosamine-1-phosphate N-acetyltransferase
MKAIALEDDLLRDEFFPFTLTRDVADIRIGILTIRQKWEWLGFQILPAAERGDAPVLPANLLPDAGLAAALLEGNGSRIEAAVAGAAYLRDAPGIAANNGQAIRSDFLLLTKGRKTTAIPPSVQVVAPENIFIEEGAVVESSFLNASGGPIYIGRDAVIMEGSMIRGPFSLGNGSVVKMGSRIYGATSVGPHSTIGGEIKNSVIFGYSNKAHDGYLGDSVIGEYCNLGAGTTNSNIKNTAGGSRVWNEAKKQFFPPALKCGVLMGDHSKTAIQTALNTGTVIGVCCHVFGQGLTPNWIPSFSWGYSPVQQYHFDKAIEHIRQWKELKQQPLSAEEIKILKYLFDQKNKNS